MAMAKRSARTGFTLIEVLVVVAIIALLVSILLPSLAGAREQAKVAVCSANLNQMGKSLMFCYNDYKEYPEHDDGYVSWHDNILATWIDVLFQRRYFPNLNTGYCPKDAQPDLFNRERGRGWGFNYPSKPNVTGCDYSYGINFLMTRIKNKPANSGFKLDQFPSNRVFVADAFWNWMHGWASDGMQYGIWNGAGDRYNSMGWRHGTNGMPTTNVLYYDGSVRLARLSLSDTYPNGTLRGVRTGDKFFWRPGEHTRISGEWEPGPLPENKLMIDGQTNFGTGFWYPNGSAPHNELRPRWYTDNAKWHRTIVAHKGWPRP